MSKRLQTSALLLFAAFASLALGFWLGVREGSHLEALAIAPVRGVFAARALTEMRNGKVEAAKIIFESEVDRGLLSVNELLESPMRHLIGSIWGVDTSSYIEDYAAKLANYRKDNASPFFGSSVSELPAETPDERAFAADVERRQRESVRIINLMIERFSSK